jgi:hypothetical protein
VEEKIQKLNATSLAAATVASKVVQRLLHGPDIGRWPKNKTTSMTDSGTIARKLNKYGGLLRLAFLFLAAELYFIALFY